MSGICDFDAPWHHGCVDMGLWDLYHPEQWALPEAVKRKGDIFSAMIGLRLVMCSIPNAGRARSHWDYDVKQLVDRYQKASASYKTLQERLPTKLQGSIDQEIKEAVTPSKSNPQTPNLQTRVTACYEKIFDLYQSSHVPGLKIIKSGSIDEIVKKAVLNFPAQEGVDHGCSHAEKTSRVDITTCFVAGDSKQRSLRHIRVTQTQREWVTHNGVTSHVCLLRREDGSLVADVRDLLNEAGINDFVISIEGGKSFILPREMRQNIVELIQREGTYSGWMCADFVRVATNKTDFIGERVERQSIGNLPVGTIIALTDLESDAHIAIALGDGYILSKDDIGGLYVQHLGKVDVPKVNDSFACYDFPYAFRMTSYDCDRGLLPITVQMQIKYNINILRTDESNEKFIIAHLGNFAMPYRGMLMSENDTSFGHDWPNVSRSGGCDWTGYDGPNIGERASSEILMRGCATDLFSDRTKCVNEWSTPAEFREAMNSAMEIPGQHSGGARDSGSGGGSDGGGCAIM